MNNVHTGTGLPCPTCFKDLPQRTSRKNKPYFVCESCGVQVFVRFEKGIERLRQIGVTRRLDPEEYVFCRTCKVAVLKSVEKVSDGLFDDPGIYCPECESLLLAEEDLEE